MGMLRSINPIPCCHSPNLPSLHVRFQTSPQQIFTGNKYHAASAKRTLSPTDVVLDAKQICTSNLIPKSTTQKSAQKMSLLQSILDNYATLFDYLKTYHLMGE